MRSARSSSRKSGDGGRTARRFRNSYEDDRRAAAYSSLDCAGTYHLAFRDMPKLIAENIKGKRALDFGCGTGRSTRFLKNLGLDVVGIDISLSMIRVARKADPEGDYRHVREADFSTLEKGSFDLVLSAFTCDNIPEGSKVRIFRGLRNLLRPSGRIINMVSSPEMYTHEWASFSTKDYPENRRAASGDVVRIITTAYEDSRPVEDILCTDESYRRIYGQSRLAVLDVLKPLAKGSEPFDWINETRIAPWTIYVLGKKQRQGV